MPAHPAWAGIRGLDADAAVSQPKLEPTLMLGFNYNF